MAGYDAIFVGSGINALVGGALLARAGWRVLVLERSDYLGGAVKTAEVTVPGFRHEVFASWHPLFTASPAYAELREDLERRGVEYLNTDLPTASLFPGGDSAFLTTSLDENVAEFDRLAGGDGAAWRRAHDEFMTNADLAFGVLGAELWSSQGLGLAAKAYRRLGRHDLLRFAGGVVSTGRHWLTETFRSERVHGLLAPWVLHTGLGPDAATSGFMTQVIAVALQMGGMPVPRGGGSRLVEALAGIIVDHGGQTRTDADVERVLVEGRRASGVRLADGERIAAERTVICCVTPTQLYGRLLADADVPEGARREGHRFRYGRAAMQIHLALSEKPRWDGDERLSRTPVVHLTPGLDAVSRAVNEADRGLLPAEATIVCGQPMVLDTTRAPDGAWILWVQLQELPSHPRGDAAGVLDVAGGWTETLRERYADRIQARLARHIPNLDAAVRGRHVLSPADLAAANPNFVGGDIYSGSLALDQNFLWRPRPGLPGHHTAVTGLYQIGASTHPGPGLGAGSGTLVARHLLEPGPVEKLRRRVKQRLRG